MTLQNGSVLAVGGMLPENHYPYTTSAELYDPATDTWARVASPKRDRFSTNAAVTLANGSVLLAGGTANTPSKTVTRTQYAHRHRQRRSADSIRAVCIVH